MPARERQPIRRATVDKCTHTLRIEFARASSTCKGDEAQVNSFPSGVRDYLSPTDGTGFPGFSTNISNCTLLPYSSPSPLQLLNCISIPLAWSPRLLIHTHQQCSSPRFSLPSPPSPSPASPRTSTGPAPPPSPAPRPTGLPSRPSLTLSSPPPAPSSPPPRPAFSRRSSAASPPCPPTPRMTSSGLSPTPSPLPSSTPSRAMSSRPASPPTSPLLLAPLLPLLPPPLLPLPPRPPLLPHRLPLLPHRLPLLPAPPLSSASPGSKLPILL
ncbi:hypothetical protein GQ54DRAFT_192203 [Martensiomyces pterosporus]|nr:hypothetical protein GQ54DRAFT_192203 [Martensiomyces pterosporus]